MPLATLLHVLWGVWCWVVNAALQGTLHYKIRRCMRSAPSQLAPAAGTDNLQVKLKSHVTHRQDGSQLSSKHLPGRARRGLRMARVPRQVVRLHVR